jgi:hypothetical protein
MTYYVLEAVLEELQDQNYPSTSMVTMDIIVQAWAAWLRQQPSLDPKKGGRVPGQPFGSNKLSFGTVTLYHLRFPPLLVKNKGTEPEMPSVLLRHCDELCETKIVTA